MLNVLWSIMILLGIVYGAMQGRLAEVTKAALDSAQEAVSLCVVMLGILSFWQGLMEIAEQAGIIAGAARVLDPLVRFLFPELPREHPARKYMMTNMIANIFGLGWAATPAGLKAMEELRKLEEQRPTVPAGTASNIMCNFLILNISSLQLIPVNVIAYRSRYGSADPAGIVGPAAAATAVSTLAGILFCKMMDKTGKKRK